MMFSRHSLRWLILGLSTLSLTAAAPTERLRNPFVPLFTLVPNGQLESEVNEETIQFIAHTYDWINSHGGAWLKGAQEWEYFAGESGVRDQAGRTVGDRLRAAKPRIILTNYRNGAYTSQNALEEAAEVEREFVLAVAVHDTGTALTSNLAPTNQLLKLSVPGLIPAGRSPVYPFKASTTNAENTIDKQQYVTWLRIGDEVMRIEQVVRKGDTIEASVRRGIWGTQATAHSAGSRVLQPVYCGAVRPNGAEYYLSGLLGGNSPQPAVRYIMQQQHPAFWEFLARKTEGILREKIDPWYDCATSSWINHANAFGDRITAPLDLETGRLLDRDRLREYQQRKFDALAQRFPDAQFYLNWVFPQWWTGTGQERLMFTGENGYRPVAGAVIEMHANHQFMPWRSLMTMQLDQRDRNIRALAWAKEADRGDDSAMDSEYQFFSYCSHLLVYEPGAPQFWGGAWKPRAPYGRFTPPDFVFWQLGRSSQRFTSIDEAEVSEVEGLYQRQFEHGTVVVNPQDEKTLRLALEQPMFDARTGLWRRELWVAPRTARILLSHPPQAN